MTTRFKVWAVITLILLGSGIFAAYSKVETQLPDRFHYRFTVEASEPTFLADDIALYEKRFQSDPTSELNSSTLAELYASEAKLTGDMMAYDRAQKYALVSLANLSTSNPNAIFVLADVAQAKHNFTSAITQAKKLLRDRPQSPEAIGILVTSYLAIGDLKNANQFADELVRVAPSTNAYALRGLALEAEGRLEESDFDFATGMSLEKPDDRRESIWIRNLSARSFVDRGNLKLAAEIADEVLRIQPGESTAMALKARIYEEHGNMAGAAKAYREAFERSKQTPFLLGEARASIAVGLRNDGEALRHQGESLLKSELSDRGYGHRSELIRLWLDRNAQGDAVSALKLARIEVQGRPNSESYYLLAWALEQNGHFMKAQSAIQTSLRSGVRRSHIYERAGFIERELGDSARAEFYFRLAGRDRTSTSLLLSDNSMTKR